MVLGRGTSSDTFLDVGTYIHRLSARLCIGVQQVFISMQVLAL